MDGLSQISHSVEFMKVIQLILFRLCIKKFKDMKLILHLHTFVVVTRAWEKLYSFNSSLMSLQNHTEIVMSNVEIFVISNAKLYLPIKRIRLMKNKSEILQYLDRSMLMALFFRFSAQQSSVIGTPKRNIIES